MSYDLIVTPLYAVALGAVFVMLSLRVIGARRSRKVGFGTGGDPELERRIRIHGNFIEYVPLALILMSFAEVRGASAAWLHLVGALLLIGRLFHAIGVSRPQTGLVGRTVGIVGSLSSILISMTLIVVHLA